MNLSLRAIQLSLISLVAVVGACASPGQDDAQQASGAAVVADDSAPGCNVGTPPPAGFCANASLVKQDAATQKECASLRDHAAPAMYASFAKCLAASATRAAGPEDPLWGFCNGLSLVDLGGYYVFCASATEAVVTYCKGPVAAALGSRFDKDACETTMSALSAAGRETLLTCLKGQPETESNPIQACAKSM